MTSPSSPRPPGPDLCSEAEVTRLVHAFYARVRADAQLGPVFEAHVDDWPMHLATLVDFWSAMLRGTRRFRGAPMQRHMVIDGMEAALFRRWLALFAQTTAELGNSDLQQQADDMAARIADTFWQRYQLQRGQRAPSRL
ncbi:group III truncated hemoglobin [Luteimonas sp. RIT-PG2_3]|jgi:hemoglobin